MNDFLQNLEQKTLSELEKLHTGTNDIKHILLGSGEYVAYSKAFLLANNIKILGEEIYECVFGYLVGEKYIFAFHLYRNDDIEHLSEEILKVFLPNEKVQIFLVSGGINTMAFPGNLTKRNLTLNNILINEKSSQNEIDSAKNTITLLNKKQDFDMDIINYDYLDLVEPCIQGDIDGFFKINFDLLNKEIKSKKLIAESEDKSLRFIIEKSSDFVSVQNLMKFSYILDLLNKNNILFKLELFFAFLGSSFITSLNFEDAIKNQVHILPEGQEPEHVLSDVSLILKGAKNYYFKSEGLAKQKKFSFFQEDDPNKNYIHKMNTNPLCKDNQKNKRKGYSSEAVEEEPNLTKKFKSEPPRVDPGFFKPSSYYAYNSPDNHQLIHYSDELLKDVTSTLASYQLDKVNELIKSRKTP